MKNKSTIVYFGNNYRYAESLCSDDTLVNLVLPDGRCIEFFLLDGEPKGVARDEIEGDAEFVIFEENYLDNMFEYTYDMIETIKAVAIAEGEEKETLIKKLQQEFNIQETNSIVDKIKGHFERNEDVRQKTHGFNEKKRRSAEVSLTELQELSLKPEDKERILAEKAKGYKPIEYERESFEAFIERVKGKEANTNALRECLKKEYTEEQIAAFGKLDKEQLEDVLKDLSKKYDIKINIPDSFFNDKQERKAILEHLKDKQSKS